MSEVREGQVWADNDRRSAGRTFRVLRVEETHALVMVLTARRNAPLDEQRRAVQSTRLIRLDRFKPTSTGYRLVSETS